MMGANTATKAELKLKVGTAHQLQETSMFGPELKPDGKFTVVGPCPYTNRKFYATVTYVAGKITKVV